MKIELSLIKNKIKQDKTWLIVYVLIFIVCIVYIFLNYKNSLDNIELSYLLIGYPQVELKDDLIFILFNLYSITYFIYFTISYLNIELENYKDNLIIREKSNKWIIRKQITIFSCLVIIKIINFVVVYILFKNIISLKFILLSIIYPLLISMVSILLNNNIKGTSVSILISIILSFFIFYYLTNIIVIALIVIIIPVLIYITFSFKKIYKLKYN